MLWPTSFGVMFSRANCILAMPVSPNSRFIVHTSVVAPSVPQFQRRTVCVALRQYGSGKRDCGWVCLGPGLPKLFGILARPSPLTPGARRA